MPSIIDSSMKVFIECVRRFSCVWQVQSKEYKDIRMKKRLIETTAQQRNKSKTSSSTSAASTLYTRGYFAEPDHCRSVFFVRWTLVRRNTVNGLAPASLLTLL